MTDHSSIHWRGHESLRCVRCGFCCKQSTCWFGEWDTAANQCKFLMPQDDNTYNCGKYEEINKIPDSAFNPAFGAGCGASLCNEDRDKILAGL